MYALILGIMEWIRRQFIQAQDLKFVPWWSEPNKLLNSYLLIKNIPHNIVYFMSGQDLFLWKMNTKMNAWQAALLSTRYHTAHVHFGIHDHHLLEVKSSNFVPMLLSNTLSLPKHVNAKANGESFKLVWIFRVLDDFAWRCRKFKDVRKACWES